MANEKRIDLIDRKAFIAEYCKNCGGGCDLDDECCVTVDDIMKAPTVDAVEVVHAYWMYDGDEVDGNIQAHCSNCFAGDVHATWKKNNIPYCWNCGAKMDGEARNES